MKLRYLGHSAFLITTNEGLDILIDPYLDRNPLAPIKSTQIKADYIVLTHAHGDHLGDALHIAKMGATTFICVSELASLISKRGHKVHAMQIGGAFNFPFGRLKLVPAMHGSMTPEGQYGGLAAGVLMQIDGKTIYHSGDTGIFGDMQLIGQMNHIDIALLPIGGNYTMDATDALWALDLLLPDLTIPMHYNTFEVIQADAEGFARQAAIKGYKVRVLQPGQLLE